MKKNALVYGIMFFGFIGIATVLSYCVADKADDIVIPSKEIHATERTEKIIQPLYNPCDSPWVLLCVWQGNPGHAIPSTIYHGVFRGKDYWFAKLSFGNVLRPPNYQQDPLRERMGVTDSLPITAQDSFLICRKFWK